MMRFRGICLVLGFILLAGLTQGDSLRVSELGSCPVISIKDAILRLPDSICHLHHYYEVAVIEGDEGSLQKVLHLAYSHRHDYVAVLFYAPWCPFSKNFRPIFSILSTLYPSIPHFAIAESAVKPSVLSKYGVYGFPAILLLNSTMRVHYHGSRSLNSLVSFYSDVTGIDGDPRDMLPFDKMESTSNQEMTENEQPDDCPFSWARSPENMLRQETYLALATMFVLLRLMYFLFPYLLKFGRFSWRRYMQHFRLTALWEHPLCFLNKSKHFLSSFRDPRKGSNFQEGALNARAWASKSLASSSRLGPAIASS